MSRLLNKVCYSIIYLYKIFFSPPLKSTRESFQQRPPLCLSRRACHSTASPLLGSNRSSRGCIQPSPEIRILFAIFLLCACTSMSTTRRASLLRRLFFSNDPSWNPPAPSCTSRRRQDVCSPCNPNRPANKGGQKRRRELRQRQLGGNEICGGFVRK